MIGAGSSFTDILNQLLLVRWLKKGSWVLTKDRGWLTQDDYEDCLSYSFYPSVIRHISYK